MNFSSKIGLVLLTILLVISNVVANNYALIMIVFFLILTIVFLKGKIFIIHTQPIFGIYVLILLIGTIMGLLYVTENKYAFHDYLRDLISFYAPFAYAYLGYAFIKLNILEKNTLYKSYVYAGIIISIWHLLTVIFVYKGAFYESRAGSNFASDVTTVALFIFLFCGKDLYLSIYKNKLLRSGCITLFIVSLIGYVSRTVMCLILCLLFTTCFSSVKKIIPKIIKISLVGIVVISLFSYILPTDTVDTFKNKITNSFAEISAKNSWDEAGINSDWRGYETFKTQEQIKSAPLINQIFGFGAGARLDLGLSINLDGTSYSAIPVLHSGYSYMLLKLGISSIVVILFIEIFYFIKYIHRVRRYKDFDDKMNLGIIIYITIALTFSGTIVSLGTNFALFMYLIMTTKINVERT